MAHIFSEEGENILDKELKVLDKGFIRLVDYYGTDARIVQSARVSYGEGTKTSREDKGLIDYLLRNEHTSPFEQVAFTFHCKMPIFVARQWVRHRTARLNEISGRYSIMKDEFYIPTPDKVSYQSTNNKQGRSTDEVPVELREQVLHILTDASKGVYGEYQKLIDKGIARELARICLPLNLYTEWYWQIDLHNLLHFLKLRLDAHAQYEIREYASAMADVVRKICPYTWESFEEHTLHGVKLSRTEVTTLKAVFKNEKIDKASKAYQSLISKLPYLES